MGKFLQVTMVDPEDKNDTWLMTVCLDAIQMFQGAGDGTTMVRFVGGNRWSYIKIGYEELKGILEGERGRWPKGELEMMTHGICPKCGNSHHMDQVCEAVQRCPKCDHALPWCNCTEAPEDKVWLCPKCDQACNCEPLGYCPKCGGDQCVCPK